MNRICAHCSSAFEITTEDLAFYDKISPVFRGKKELIPPPSLCPDCRQQRRLAFRNERHLYHRKCDLTGKQIISIYSPDKPYKIYDQEEWWSDRFDVRTFGRDVDLHRSFFSQFADLMRVVPRRNLMYFQNENSEYTNVGSHNKNCYLLFSSDQCEDCFFISNMQKSRQCLECSIGSDNQYCYECLNTQGCYKCRSCVDMKTCSDCLFSVDCIGCSECAFCSNLRNAKYCIGNRQHTESEYRSVIGPLLRGSHAELEQAHRHFQDVLLRTVRKSIHGQQHEASTGDYLTSTRHCMECFNVLDSQDCARLWDGVGCKDSMDCNEVGYCDLSHEVIEVFPKGYNVHCVCFGAELSDVFYSDHCYSSSNLFGCVGLQKAQYCVLNKQYSREEYEALVPKIIERMRRPPSNSLDRSFAGQEWGEFFPMTMSPFAYNETNAQDYFPLTQEQCAKAGLQWHDEEDSKEQYLGPSYEIPDSIADVPDDIVKHILRCDVTGKPYKIIPQELKFYRSMDIPVPRKCPEQRHKERMALRNPRQLWHRKCAKCGKPIETSYAPDREEIVYCEECYLASVY